MATDCTTGAPFDTRARQSLRRRLLGWYAKHRRDLPWRENSEPYRVWVSEVMLQQTQVATVRDYFLRFMKAFPDVAALAAADEQQVLRLWEGLGYYRRARGLHAAAKEILERYGGRFPSDVEELQTLPGIGRYTAGAIASIAYGQRAPILEANTIRLLSRLVGYREDPTRTAGQKLLWGVAEELLPQKNVAEFNQALMELGSLVCRPSEPDCPACPLREQCVAYRAGLVAEIPRAKVRQQFTQLYEAAVVVGKNGSVLLRQCGDDERWAGLWDFPRFELSSENPANVRKEIIAAVRELTGIECRPAERLTTLKHGVTRYRIALDCYRAEFVRGRVVGRQPTRWVKRSALGEYPLSTTGRKLARLL